MPRRNIRIIVIVILCCLPCALRSTRTERIFRYVMMQIQQRAISPPEGGEHALLEGALEGMARTLDEYSAYVTSERLAEYQESIDNEFVGIGVHMVVDPDTEQLVVRCPVFGSPAQKAGIRAGDRIIEVDGRAVEDMDIDEAGTAIRGPAGEVVTLTVLHNGDETPETIDIVRDKVYVESVLGRRRLGDGSFDFVLEDDARIGYLWIDSFTERTAEEVEEAVRGLLNDGAKALVIDMRYNPGGILTDAVDVCDLFIDEGDIVTTRDRYGNVRPGGDHDASSENTVTADVPLAILIDDNTASAAEIVAACLQDHGRAVIIGERSYGKGTVQDLLELQDDLGLLKLTTAKYWRPSGRNIQRPSEPKPGDIYGVSPNEGFEYDLDDEQRREVLIDRDARGHIPVGSEDMIPDLTDEPPAPEEESPSNDAPPASDGNNDEARDDTPSEEEDGPEDGPVEDVELLRAIEYLQEQIEA